jgi:hypothetical protein
MAVLAVVVMVPVIVIMTVGVVMTMGMIVAATAARAVLMVLVAMIVAMGVGVHVIMIVVVIMIVIMVMMAVRMVMIMSVIMTATAVRAMDMGMRGGGAGGLPGLAPLDRGGQFGIVDRRLARVGVAMIVVVVMMTVIVMIVAVIMIVAMRMTVIVMVMPVLVALHLAVAVGAAFRHEGGLDEADLGGAELLHHLDQHVVVADAQHVRADLRRGVAVAEVPGHAGERERIGEAELDQPLGLRLDRHDEAVVEPVAVAVPDRGNLGEVDQEFEAVPALHRHAAAAAVLEIEFDAVDDLIGGEAAGESGGGGAHHGEVMPFGRKPGSSRRSRG